MKKHVLLLFLQRTLLKPDIWFILLPHLELCIVPNKFPTEPSNAFLFRSVMKLPMIWTVEKSCYSIAIVEEPALQILFGQSCLMFYKLSKEYIMTWYAGCFSTARIKAKCNFTIICPGHYLSCRKLPCPRRQSSLPIVNREIVIPESHHIILRHMPKVNHTPFCTRTSQITL